MLLSTGTRLGPYEITALISAGGMGEVYRARDTKLNRDVALKVLPEAFALDRDRVARFRREAQLLASLNHPNIAAIYGFEEGPAEAGHYGSPVQALVLELVEGPTLAETIERGAGPSGPTGLPLDEALPIARQVADALEAAHEHGVVHRDLKPANIKLRPDGTVKVLDFGLAKALDPISASGETTESPTMTSPALTRLGVILGTAAYMAPEQARGRAVDKRADIWAFGCVLFEMLTGRRAFQGEDVAETIGAVIHKEPAWSALPAGTPAYLRILLRRCLQKDPKKRLPHIGVARIEIDEAPPDASAPSSEAAAISRRRVWNDVRSAWSVAAVALAAAVALGVTAYWARGTVDTRVTRASILPPPGGAWARVAPGTGFTLSPDGLNLAFIGMGDGGQRLWVRPIEAVTAQPLAGTEGAVVARWSPDGRSLAFVAGGRLRRIDASGGLAVTLAEKATNWGLAWGPDDTILFVPDSQGPLFRVSASGGTPSQVTTLDAASGDAGHGNPFFLREGRHFLYLARGSTTAINEARAVYVRSLDAAEEPRLLLRGVSNAQYASGYLLFMRETTLMAQPFDGDRLELSGQAVPVAAPVQIGGATGVAGAFSVSETGVLVYQPGTTDIRSQLTWYDRAGKQIGTLGEPADQMHIELSPDGTRALASVLGQTGRSRDLWIYDVRRGLRTRFTFDPGNEVMSAWSPDGSQVVFNSRRTTRLDLYLKASSGVGAEELLVSDDQDKEPYSWSHDGRFVAYHNLAAIGGTAQNLWTVPLTGDRKPAVFLQTEFSELRPRFSPDGRWLAYASNESGRREVYVVPFPDRSGKWQVSTAGGDWPRWSGDGKELFYLAPDNTLTSAAVSVKGAALDVGNVQPLFEVRPRPISFAGDIGYGYDVSADGQRFLVNTLLEEASVDPITLLVNWPALLRR